MLWNGNSLKMKKLYYHYYNRLNWINEHAEKETIDMFLEPAYKDKSCPFHQLNLYMNSFNFNSIFDGLDWVKNSFVSGTVSAKDYSDIIKASPNTAKVCPGLNGILHNSYLVKSPCDYHISIIGDRVLGNCPQGTESLMGVASHPSEQFETKHGDSLFPNMINVKFELPIFIKSTEPILFLQPFLHKNVPWVVINGVLENSYINLGQPLSINTLLPKELTSITIKCGDPLAYIWSPKKLKLTKAKKMPLFFHRRFVGS